MVNTHDFSVRHAISCRPSGPGGLKNAGTDCRCTSNATVYLPTRQECHDSSCNHDARVVRQVRW